MRAMRCSSLYRVIGVSAPNTAEMSASDPHHSEPLKDRDRRPDVVVSLRDHELTRARIEAAPFGYPRRTTGLGRVGDAGRYPWHKVLEDFT